MKMKRNTESSRAEGEGHGRLDAFDIKGTLSKKQRLIGLKRCISPFTGRACIYRMNQREKERDRERGKVSWLKRYTLWFPVSSAFHVFSFRNLLVSFWLFPARVVVTSPVSTATPSCVEPRAVSKFPSMYPLWNEQKPGRRILLNSLVFEARARRELWNELRGAASK